MKIVQKCGMPYAPIFGQTGEMDDLVNPRSWLLIAIILI